MFFRLFGFFLSIYYTANILRLPKVFARNTEIPRYVKGYTAALGMNMVFYVLVIAFFTTTLMMIYIGTFTIINMYLFFRTLETMAVHLPKPEILEIIEEVTETVEVQKTEPEEQPL